MTAIDDHVRLVEVASLLGSASDALLVLDLGAADCPATLETLRGLVERMSTAVRIGGWPR